MFNIDLDQRFSKQDFYWELSYLHQQWLTRAWAKAKKLHKGISPEYHILGHNVISPWLVENHGKEIELSEIEEKIKQFCGCCE